MYSEMATHYVAISENIVYIRLHWVTRTSRGLTNTIPLVAGLRESFIDLSKCSEKVRWRCLISTILYKT